MIEGHGIGEEGYIKPPTLRAEDVIKKTGIPGIGRGEEGFVPLPSVEEQQTARIERIKDVASRSENPQEELESIVAADYIAHRLGMDTSHVYRNLDTYSEVYFQTKMPAKSLGRAVKDEIERADKSIKMSKAGLDMMMNVYDDKAFQEYEALLQSMPVPDNADRNIFEKGLKAAGTILPSMGYVLANGLTTGTVTAGVGMIAGSFLGPGGIAAGGKVGFDVGMRLGSGKESFALSGGAVFAEAMMTEIPGAGKKLYEYIQDDAENPDEVMNIARAAAIGTGAISASVEMLLPSFGKMTGLSGDVLDSIGDKAYKSILKKGAVSNVVLKALTRYGINVGEETLQEVTQEIAEMSGGELIKGLINKAEELNIPKATIDEWAAVVKETASQTAMGMATLGVFGASVQAYRDGSKAIKKTADGEKSIFRESGSSNASLIEKIQLTNEPSGEEYTRARERFDKARSEGGTIPPLKVIRDAEGNYQAMDNAMAKVVMEEGFQNIEIEVVSAPAESSASAQVAKPDWMRNSQDFNEWKNGFTQREAQFKETQTIEDFEYNVKTAFPDMTDSERQATVAMVEARAAVNGMDVSEYIQNTFDTKVFTTEKIPGQSYKAAAAFKESGKALIHLTEQSDFSSWVHEYGHIIRKELPQTDLQILQDHYGDQDWTTVSEESFVKDFEDYLHKGKAPNEELRTLFQKIAAGLKKVFDRIGRTLDETRKLPAEVTDVFDRIFTPQGVVKADLSPKIQKEQQKRFVAQPTDQWFEKTENSRSIPLEQIERREEIQDTAKLQRAQENIHQAEAGTGPKRAPVKVLEISKGKYRIADGNTTWHVMKDKNAAALEAEIVEMKQPTRDLSELYSLVEESQGDLDSFTAFYADKFDGSVLQRPVNEESGKRLKARDRAERKLEDVLGAERIFDLAGSTVVFKDITTIKEAVKAALEDPRVIRLKDRYDKPALGGYMDVLMNIRAENGAVIEVQFNTQQMVDAKKKAGHTLYEVIDQTETAYKDGKISESEKVAAIKAAVEASEKLYSAAKAAILEDNIFSMSSFDISEELVIISDNLTRSPAGESVLSGKTLNKLKELSMAIGKSSQSANLNPSESMVNGSDINKSSDHISILEEADAGNNQNLKDILFQESEHEEIIRKAIEEYKPVPQDVLDEYGDRDWAIRENRRRETLKKYSWLVDMAFGMDSPDEFKDFILRIGSAEEIDAARKLGGEGEEKFYKEIWSRANLKTREQANNEFIKRYANETAVTALAIEVTANPEVWKGKGIPGSIWMLGNSFKGSTKQNARERFIQAAITSVKNNPLAIRQAFAAQNGDQVDITQLQYEEEIENATPEEVVIGRLSTEDRLKEAANADDPKIRAMLLSGIGTDSESLVQFDREMHQRMGVLKSQQTKEVEKLKNLLKASDSKIDDLINSRERLSEALKNAKSEAEKEAYKKIQEFKAEMRAKQKQQKEVQEIKDRMRMLAKNILRKPAEDCHYSFKEEIREIQDGLDGRFRRPKTAEALKKRREFYEANPEVKQLIDPEVLKVINQKPLNEWTLIELENLNNKVNRLRQMGKDKQQRIVEDRKQKVLELASKMALEIGNGKIVTVPKYATNTDDYKEWKKTGKVDAVMLNTLRPSRILKDLAGENSELVKFFWEKMNQHTDESIRRKLERIEAGKRKMAELGITEKELAQKILIPGAEEGPQSVNDVIQMYITRKNEKNWRAIVHGVGVKNPGKYIQHLTAEQMALGDFIAADFEAHHERYAEAYAIDKNDILGKVPGYFPMKRQTLLNEARNDEVMRDMGTSAGVMDGYASRNSTKTRIDIGDEHQAPIRMGAWDLWMEEVEKQEHYIASARYIKEMHGILKNPAFQAALVEKHGHGIIQWFEKYINEFANPNLYKYYDAVSKVSRILRNNTALAYLAYNTLTIAKQAPSLALFMGRVGPHRLMAAAGKFMSNPVKWLDFVNERDPQMKERSMDRLLEELKLEQEHPVQKVISKFGQIGMKPIMMVDKMATTIGWLAVYDAHILQGEDIAIRKAQESILETQPAARAKDLAMLYKSNEGFNWFLMFTNQINQQWNMMTSDIPRAVRQAQVSQALGMVAGLGVSMASIAVLSGWRPWEADDPEDFAKDASIQLIKAVGNTVPVVGKAFTSGVDGWMSSGVDPVPLAAESGKLLKEILDGDTVGIIKKLPKFAETAAVLRGLPIMPVKRGIKAGKRIADEEYEKAILEFIGYKTE